MNEKGGDLELLGAGRTAEVYAYDEHTILKLYMDWMPVEAIEKEFTNTRYATGLGVRAPEVFDLISIEGRRGILCRRLKGISMLKAIAGAPLQIGVHAVQFAALHANMHAIVVKDGLAVQSELLASNIRRTPLLDEGDKVRILAYLISLGGGDRLCHGDYHPDNIIIDNQYWIIDWMTANAGNPACDVARTMLLLTLSAFPPGISRASRLLFTVARNLLATLYLRAYQRATGLPKTDVERWYLPVAAARLAEGNSEEESQRLLRLIHQELARTDRSKNPLK
jgi:hypothetical protein